MIIERAFLRNGLYADLATFVCGDARGSFEGQLALTVIFFFVLGLELKHELTAGQLAHPRAALVPAVAAFAGAVVPAAVFLAITRGGPEDRQRRRPSARP